MIMKYTLILAALMLFLAIPTLAMAEPTAVGEGEEGGTWSQQYHWTLNNGTYPDAIAYRFISGNVGPDLYAGWDVPGLRVAGSPSNWHLGVNNQTIVCIYDLPQGANGDFYYTVFAKGLNENTSVYDVAAFVNGRIVEEDRHLSGAGSSDVWAVNTTYWQPSYASVIVPAPAAVVLGMMGLGLIGWMKRRVG
jgi:hypothetical protein